MYFSVSHMQLPICSKCEKRERCRNGGVSSTKSKWHRNCGKLGQGDNCALRMPSRSAGYSKRHCILTARYPDAGCRLTAHAPITCSPHTPLFLPQLYTYSVEGRQNLELPWNLPAASRRRICGNRTERTLYFEPGTGHEWSIASEQCSTPPSNVTAYLSRVTD